MASINPEDWTVEELIRQICHSTTLFEQIGCSPAALPDAKSLEAHLQEWSMTGRQFLEINDHTLERWFGISSPEQRWAILRVSNHLRSQSFAYSGRFAVQGFRSSNFEGMNRARVPHFGVRNNKLSLGSGNTQSKRISNIDTAPLSSRSLPVQDATLNASGILGRNPPISSTIGTSNVGVEENWDHLAHWNNKRHIIQPDANDDMDYEDAEGSVSSEDENNEQEAEVQEPIQSAKGRSILSPEQVTNIINDFISEYTDKWIPGKHTDSVLDQAYDAHELWHELRSQPVEERQEVINNTQGEIERYEYKLDKLCEAIFQDQWTSEKAVRQQCASLEYTIDLLEQEKWELKVYLQDAPPPMTAEDEGNSHPVEHEPNRQIIQAHYQGDHDAGHIVYSDDWQEDRQKTPGKAPAADAPPPATEIIDLGSSSESENEADNDPMFVEVDEVPKSTNTSRNAPCTPPTSTVLQDITETFTMPDDMVIDSIEPPSSASKKRTPRQYPNMPMAHERQDSSVRSQDAPEDASYATVSRWKWQDLKEKKDRKRIVMKILQEMPSSDRDMIRTHILSVQKQDLISELSVRVAMMLRGQNWIPGILPGDLPKVIKFTNLFLSWWLADDHLSSEDNVVRRERLQELSDCLRNGARDPVIFVDWTRYVFERTFSKENLKDLGAPSQAEIILISSDDEESALPRSTPSKRKAKATPRRKPQVL